MNAIPPATCALGLSPETLSAWRDSMLSVGEVAHIEAHIAGCAACRAHLADYATIAGALLAERVPSPDASLWRDLQVRLRAVPTHRAPALSRSWLGTLAAVAAVLLLVAGFARLFNGKTPSVAPAWTPAPTPTPTQPAGVAVAGPTLAWYPVASGHHPTVAPGDGDVAYDAFLDGNHPTTLPQFWATRDRGNSWQRMADIPSRQQADDLQIFIDPGNASRVVAALDYRGPGYGGAGINEQTYQLFVTTDGGASWHALPTQRSTPQLLGLTSYANTTYAIRSVLDTQSNAFATDLYASSDNMHTWQPLTSALTGSASGSWVKGFWLNQATGTLLVQIAVSDQSQTLYRSDDGGQHWTRLTGLTYSPATTVVAQLTGTPTSWRVCAVYVDVNLPQDTNHVTCSADGGQHWAAQPALAHDASGAPIANYVPLAMANDGALLVTSTPNQNSTTALFRLPVDAPTWQQLTQLQGSASSGTPAILAYAPQPGTGILWATDANGHPLVAVYP